MFSGKEANLDKLVNKQHIDLQVVAQSQGKDEKGKSFYQVMAKGIVFDDKVVADRGPQIIKSVQMLATGNSIEEAQDNALAKVQKLLLGV